MSETPGTVALRYPHIWAFFAAVLAGVAAWPSTPPIVRSLAAASAVHTLALLVLGGDSR